MKTTLNIDDNLMKKLKTESVRQGKTMSELLETALRGFLERKKPVRKLPALPVFDGGEMLVNVANRDSLYDTMDKK
jgi:hypothetical protein